MIGGLNQVAPRKRQRLKKAVTLAASAQGGIHKRLSEDLPINSRVAVVEVDDPFEPGAKVLTFRSLRNDPLAALRAAGQVDETQYLAGRHWQHCYEMAELGGARAIDTTREVVDGGQIAQATITDQQIKAFGDLAKAITALGMEGDILIRDFLGRGLTLSDIATKRGADTERQRRYLGDRLREALQTLSIVFGYASSAQNPQDIVSRGFTRLPACGRR